MSAYDSAALLANIRRRAMAPTAASLGTTDTDLLALADDELRYGLLPMLLAVREEFYNWKTDTTIVGGQQNYRIPSRAIGPKLRELTTVDGAGKVTDLSETRIERLDGPAPTPGQPIAFYLDGNTVALYPPPAASNTGLLLRQTFHIRPNRLVATAAAGVVQSVNTGTGAVTLTGTPPTGFVTGATFDFVRGSPGFEHLAIDLAGTVAGNVVTVGAANLPTGALALAAGDYVCLSETTPVPQLPVELHAVLAQRVANNLLRSLGALDRLAAGEALLQQLEKGAAILLTTRVEGEIEVLYDDAFFPVRTLAW